MIFKIVNDILINSTDKRRFDKGHKYYKDGYIQSVKYTNKNKILTIEGEVASANNSSVYNSSIIIDLKNKNIENAFCDCEDYHKRSSYGDFNLCKHIVASGLYVCNLLKSDVISNLKQTTFVVKNNDKIKRNIDFINKD